MIVVVVLGAVLAVVFEVSLISILSSLLHSLFFDQGMNMEILDQVQAIFAAYPEEYVLKFDFSTLFNARITCSNSRTRTTISCKQQRSR